jgi:hypothetical protein
MNGLHSSVAAFSAAPTSRPLSISALSSSPRPLSALSQSVSSDVLVAASADLINAAVETTTSSSAPAAVFEPILPSTNTLVGMTVIVILCAAVAWVWQTQVVPTARTNLAISKSRGPVKDYLDELREAGRLASDDIDGDTTLPLDLADAEGTTNPPTVKEKVPHSSARALERWLFTDWLLNNKSARKAGRQKEAAIPILKDAKWNSGDNPVLAATLLIGLGVLFSAVTERVATTSF